MKKQRIICTALAAALTVSLFAGCTDKNGGGQTDDPSVGTEAEAETEVNTAAKVSVEGTKFMVDGKELIINGVNTPWENWNEFGTDNFDPNFWDSHFAELHDIGVNSVRVWLSCTGTVCIKLRRETGEVYKVEEKFWDDVDKLFEIAAKHQIYLMPTMLSFDHFKDAGSQLRWRMLVDDDTAMQTYFDMYLKPFAERYGSNPYLLGIDLMNEPDWVHENEECGKLPFETLSKFFAKSTAAIHETNPDALVTVGIAMIKYNSDQYEGDMVSDEIMKQYGGENACIDFYSTHYYDYMKPWFKCPYGMSPTDYGLKDVKPAVIGETSAEGGETLAGLYEKCYNSGWNGVMLWKSNDGANHEANWADIEEATKKIEEIAPEKVFPLGKK